MSQSTFQEKTLFDVIIFILIVLQDDDFPIINESQPTQEESELINTSSQQDKVQKSPAREKERQHFSYEEDLWDSLPSIVSNQKRGSQLLFGFSHFCKNYIKVLQTFSHGLGRCTDNFEKEMLCQNGFDTTTIAITSIKQGMDEVVKVITNKINMVVGDLIEPMELYYNHYSQTSQESLNQAQAIWKDLEDDKRIFQNSQDRYYRLMNDVEDSELAIEEALLEHEKGLLPLDKVQNITNQALNIKYKSEIACQDYKREAERMNQTLPKFEDEYKPLLSQLQQGEESRINFLKYSFEKFLKHLNSLGKNISDKSIEMASQITMINSETDLKIFIDENRTHQEFKGKVQFKQYEHSEEFRQQKAQLMEQINLQKKKSSGGLQAHLNRFNNEEPDEEKMLKYLKALIRGQDITFDEKGGIIQALHNSQVRETVAEFLKSINSPRNIENANALKTLGELIKYLLTAFVHEKDENYKVIHAILHSSQLIYHLKDKTESSSDKQKIFLTSYLNDHGIWQEQQVWKVCIQKLINQKFHEAINSPGVLAAKAQSQIQNNNAQPSGIMGIFKGSIWGTAKESQDQNQQKNQDQISNWSNKGGNSTVKIQKSLAQNIIFNTLSKFLYHFLNFQYSFESSRDVLLSFCEKYELDQNRTHLLLSELESIQKKSRIIVSPKDLLSISIEKRDHRINKYGNSTILILAQSLRFLDSDYTLRNILCLSKDYHKNLKKLIYKQVLLFSEVERLKVKRIPIWINLMRIRENIGDYNAFKNKIMNDASYIEKVEDVINMDVQRSFTRMKDLDPAVLTNILKTYAFFNPEIEYCQGMNFVAGFLYLVFKDEEIAFKALQEIVEIFDMAELFNEEVPKLKLFFYQMDRLVSIWLPQLNSHFKDEMITSSYYCSPWFITIFTNSLQNQEGKEISQKLYQLWDYFLTSGWKAIFKMGLIMLKQNEQELLTMSFEEILNYVTEKPKLQLSELGTPLSKEHLIYHELNQASKGMVNLNYMLRRLEKEFSDSLQASQVTNPQKDKRNIGKRSFQSYQNPQQFEEEKQK